MGDDKDENGRSVLGRERIPEARRRFTFVKRNRRASDYLLLFYVLFFFVFKSTQKKPFKLIAGVRRSSSLLNLLASYLPLPSGQTASLATISPLGRFFFFFFIEPAHMWEEHRQISQNALWEEKKKR